MQVFYSSLVKYIVHSALHLKITFQLLIKLDKLLSHDIKFPVLISADKDAYSSFGHLCKVSMEIRAPAHIRHSENTTWRQ